ncbi:MAG: CpaF family protein [Phycisphaerales bacterium]|nr:CpaF family protein [Phycisphaerales bacterium]
MSVAHTASGASELARLRRELHQRLLATFDFGDADKASAGALEAECRTRVEALLDASGARLEPADRSRIVDGVLDDAFRLGPLEPLLADPDVTDVLVTGPDRVFVERHGQLQQSGARFRDTAHLMHVIQRVVRTAGRRIDERSPMVDARLPDGSRVNAIIPPIAVDAPQLSIRRFPASALTLEQLVELGTLPAATAELIRAAVRGRLNVIFSGGAGVGKTTVLNAASASIGSRERVITIEDAAELRLLGEHVVRLETRAANVEGVGALEPRDLVRNALRMRPDRIIVGECRGAEAFDMMQAMNTGHEGSMTTLHANSARDTLARLEMMLAMGGFDMPVRVIRDYVASAIHLVVHLARLPDGRRVMSEAIEVTGSGADGITVRTIHVLELHSRDEGAAHGTFASTGEQPSFLARLRTRGVHVDPAIFRAGPLSASLGP